MNDEIMVSILCPVYNHEKSLEKCINGFIMQKTNFKFEIIINDDASTDSSANIIKRYEEKYPDIIRPIYQTENQYSKNVRITDEILLPKARGKYIALCEGDDFWTDENKLQRQFDVMENNTKIAMCVHKVQVENTNDIFDIIPKNNICEGLFKEENFLELFVETNNYPFHTSSYFVRASLMREMVENAPLFAKVFHEFCGDVPRMMYMAVSGGIMYIDKIMSCYGCSAKDSWHSRMSNKDNYIINSKNNIAAFILYDIYTNGKYSNLIEEIINQEILYICQLKKEYMEIINKRYKKTLKKLSFRQRTYYKAVGILQLVRNKYKNVLENINLFSKCN